MAARRRSLASAPSIRCPPGELVYGLLRLFLVVVTRLNLLCQRVTRATGSGTRFCSSHTASRWSRAPRRGPTAWCATRTWGSHRAGGWPPCAWAASQD
eukprot:39514-Eustigmatos_ZCMA.PRE.1